MNPMKRQGTSDAPQIATVEDLLAKMRAGTKEVHEIRLRDLTIPVRILAVDEINRIRRDAIAHMAKTLGDETDKSLHIQKCTLSMASNVSKGGAPLLSEKLLSMLSTDEINFLYNEYIKVMEEVNPSLESIDPDRFRALVDAIKKNTITARDCSLPVLRAIFFAYQDLIQRQENRTSRPDN